jgi:hypothetical protein
MKAATLAALLVFFAAHPVDAQPAGDLKAAALVSTDPIRCWWQSDAGAVTIGQSFSVTLTCAVIDTDAVQVVPDESRLGVATVQVAPFEILGGSHPSDARSGSRRFFQYQYTLRIIDPDVIGRDVKIPNLPIQYRVRSHMNAASTLEGRDLTYVMPALPIKVLSLVPAEATDIRDGSEAGFGVVDTLRFRASLFRVIGTAFGVIALIVGVWALAPWARLARRVSPESAHHIPDRVVLRELRVQLDTLKSETEREWTDDLVVRALRLVRLVSSFAIGRPISQRSVTSDGVVTTRIPVSHGVIRPARVTVASSVTADDVARAMGDMPEAEAARPGELEVLRDGLTALTEAAYRQTGERDSARLDAALNAAIAATSRLASERGVLSEWSAGIGRSFGKKASPW